MPRSAVLLLFVFLSGCSASTRAVIRLDTGQGEPIVHTPRRDVEPVAVSEKELKKAVAQHAPSVPAAEHPLEHARQVFGLPEPVSKGIAALMTLGAMAYLGWDTVWRLIDGWLVLMKEVDEATTFDGIHASGEKFGDTMGEKAARAFVMLGTVALGNTASGMAATLPRLPGAEKAAVVAEMHLNLRFTAPALVRSRSCSRITVSETSRSFTFPQLPRPREESPSDDRNVLCRLLLARPARIRRGLRTTRGAVLPPPGALRPSVDPLV